MALVPTGPSIAGIKAYSKDQFHKVKPQGDYRNYLQYLVANRTNPKVPKAAAAVAEPNYASLLKQTMVGIESPAQVEARANRMVNQQIAREKAMILEQAKMDRADALRTFQAQSAAGRAAAAMNSGLFGMVGGEYNAGAQELASMATGLTGAAAGATAADTAGIDTSIANVGGNPVATSGAMAGPAQQGVEAWRGGTNPAANIRTQGEAAQFGLAGMVNAQNLRATQEATMGQTQTNFKVQQAKATALKELLAGRPGRAATILEQLTTSNRQGIALAQGLIAARNATRLDTKKLGLTEKELNAKIKADNAALKRAAELQNIEWGRIDPAASKVAEILVDKKGRPILDAHNNPIPVKSGSGSGGLTPKQIQDQVDKAEPLVRGMFFGYVTQDGKRIPADQADGFDETKIKTYGKNRLTYDAAVKRLKAMKVPQAAANEILGEYYARGDMGRPIVSNSEAQAVVRRMVMENHSLLLTSPQGKMTKAKAQAEVEDIAKRAQAAYDAGDNDTGDWLTGLLTDYAGV